jgi:hypothetical protein
MQVYSHAAQSHDQHTQPAHEASAEHDSTQGMAAHKTPIAVRTHTAPPSRSGSMHPTRPAQHAASILKMGQRQKPLVAAAAV